MADEEEELRRQIVNGKMITAPFSGGTIKGGAEISIGVPADGQLHWFRAPHELLPTIVGNLQSFGAAATKARHGTPLSTTEGVAFPYHYRGHRTWHGFGGQIALEIQTTEGIPIQVAMTPDQARTVASVLLAEAGKPSPSPPRRS